MKRYSLCEKLTPMGVEMPKMCVPFFLSVSRLPFILGMVVLLKK